MADKLEPPAAAQPATAMDKLFAWLEAEHGPEQARKILAAAQAALQPPAAVVQPDELRDLCECEHERHMHGEPTSDGWADDCRFCTCNAFTLAKPPVSAVSPTLTKEEVIIVREGLRALDRGALHCRYCVARAPEWDHSRSCPYADSVRVVEQARAILDRLQSAVVSPTQLDRFYPAIREWRDQSGVSAVVFPVSDVAELVAEIERLTTPRFTCQARKTTDPLQDCDWPCCGCDPYADKVIAALEESGKLKSSAVSPTDPTQEQLELNGWRELGEEIGRVISLMDAETREDWFPDWFRPRLFDLQVMKGKR